MKTLSLILTFTTAIGAQAAPADIYKSLGLSQGTVEVIKDADDNCSGGPFRFVGKAGEEVLQIGSNITFHQPTKEKERTVTADAETCAEDVEGKLLTKKLYMKTAVHSCPPKMKKLEHVTEELLEVDKQQIKYTKKDNVEKIECTFKWSENEKK